MLVRPFGALFKYPQSIPARAHRQSSPPSSRRRSGRRRRGRRAESRTPSPTLTERMILRVSGRVGALVGRNFAADSAKRRHPGNETPWKVEPFPRYAKKFMGRFGATRTGGGCSCRSLSFAPLSFSLSSCRGGASEVERRAAGGGWRAVRGEERK